MAFASTLAIACMKLMSSEVNSMCVSCEPSTPNGSPVPLIGTAAPRSALPGGQRRTSAKRRSLSQSVTTIGAPAVRV